MGTLNWEASGDASPLPWPAGTNTSCLLRIFIGNRGIVAFLALEEPFVTCKFGMSPTFFLISFTLTQLAGHNAPSQR